MYEYVEKIPEAGLVKIDINGDVSFHKLNYDYRYIHFFKIIQTLYKGEPPNKNIYFLFAKWDECSLLKKCSLTGTIWDYHIQNHNYTIPENHNQYLNFIIASKVPDCHDDILSTS